MSRIHYTDIEELAVAVLGLNEDDDPDSDTIEQAIYDKFECDFNVFHKIVESLIDFTIPAKSALTETVFNGFVKDGMFIVKCETKK